MARSMTGFGRCQRVVNGRDITIEIKSVNHRYFEFAARIKGNYGYLEERLKSFVQGKVSRGKVDVNLFITSSIAADASVQINHELARSYINAFRELADETGLTDDIKVSTLARFPEIFVVEKKPEDEDAIWADVKEVAAEALESFLAMRSAEGAKLREDITARLDVVSRLVVEVERQSPKTVEDYRNRLFAKLSDILAERGIDEQRVLTEAAIFAERVAVAEETVRLHSHVEQFREILSKEDAIGRKLDFLIQELNREVNTIGSKSQSFDIGMVVIELKSEIEKIREQIQNIE